MNETVVRDTRERVTFTGSAGNAIAADVYRGAGERTVMFAHGGGQTRHSWRATAARLSHLGWTAVTVDQRGHGDSDWIAGGDYSFTAFANDIIAISEQVERMFGAKPVGIGASLGGIASLLAEGEVRRGALSGLVLVDITPRVNPEGVGKVLGFMAERSEDGFASLEEAADAISAYLPHRERPKDLSGLSKNLRAGDDGRFRWHWDPKFIAERSSARSRAEIEARLTAAARALTVPVLLVRGSNSELVDEHLAREFLDLVPHAKYEDVKDARHMVAGDKNDAFADAVIRFLQEPN